MWVARRAPLPATPPPLAICEYGPFGEVIRLVGMVPMCLRQASDLADVADLQARQMGALVALLLNSTSVNRVSARRSGWAMTPGLEPASEHD